MINKWPEIKTTNLYWRISYKEEQKDIKTKQHGQKVHANQLSMKLDLNLYLSTTTTDQKGLDHNYFEKVYV